MRRAAAVLAAGVLAGCGQSTAPGDLAGWNVLLLTIDTLRPDHLGFAGYEGAETPVLDGLAERGVVFERAVAPAPVTLPSHATILTGRYPPAHGALDNAVYTLAEGVPTLAHLLRARDYDTAAVIGAFVLHRQYGLADGFDLYDDHFRRPRDRGQSHRERPASEVSGIALDWLRNRPNPNRPFFLWAHYYDPHLPHQPPESFRARFRGRLYDAEIAFTDHSIGMLLDGLRDSGELARTLVVVVADHGEAFGDGGEATHGLLLRGATLDIPFVLAAPGALPEGRRVEGTVTSADLTPTVLDLVGAPVPSGLDGRSLLAEIGGSTSGGRPVYSETRLPLDQYGWSMLSGFRDDRWAWVRAPRPELYDLDADPGETTNLAGTLPDVEARLDELVEAVLAGEPARETRRRPSADELEKLHALGYVLSSDAPEATGADPKDMLEVWNGIVEIRERARGGLQESDIVREATRLLAMDPGNEELRLMRGQALVGAGRAEEGLEELAALHAENPGPGRIGAFRSRALSDAGRFAQAAELLRELAEAEPLVEDHPYHLGLTLREMGRAAEAREAFEAAHRLNPDAVHVLANLSVELSRVPGEEARAATLAERAVALAPGDDRARENLARVLGNTGRTAEAMAEVRALSAKRRLSGVSRKELADLMRELEHPAQPLGNGGQSE